MVSPKCHQPGRSGCRTAQARSPCRRPAPGRNRPSSPRAAHQPHLLCQHREDEVGSVFFSRQKVEMALPFPGEKPLPDTPPEPEAILELKDVVPPPPQRVATFRCEEGEDPVLSGIYAQETARPIGIADSRRPDHHDELPQALTPVRKKDRATDHHQHQRGRRGRALFGNQRHRAAPSGSAQDQPRRAARPPPASGVGKYRARPAPAATFIISTAEGDHAQVDPALGAPCRPRQSPRPPQKAGNESDAVRND